MNEKLKEKIYRIVKRASDNEMIDQILNAIEQDGYHKAIGKPKLLSDEEISYQIKYAYEHNPSMPLEVMLTAIIQSCCQAQLNADIRYYEGGE